MPTVHPSRLRLARELRGKSLVSVRVAIDRTDEAVRQMEAGRIDPGPYLERFSAIYDVPVSFFFGEEVRPIEKDAVSFRSLRSLSAGSRNKILGIAAIATQYLYPALSARFDLPDVNFPSLDPLGEVPGEPTKAAAALRQFWRIGYSPISSVLELCERSGVIVFWYSDDSLKSDALSFWFDDRPFVLLNSKPISRQRQNFSLSHELGHLLLHRFDKPADNAKAEAEANAFAGAFMLPAEGYQADAPRFAILEAFLPAKAKWHTSVQTLVMRNASLGLFTQWQVESAFKEIAIRKWRQREPGDLPAQSSLLHYQVLDAARFRGELPVDVAESSGLNFDVLCELMPEARIVSNLGVSES